ncbi:alpha/beta hydrolase [Franconibacter daqui]|uniref:alpha/beta hydrolase n=1 Tax=Franconibacter daqui TaxID=2047724 RepID=UPI003D9A39C0
MRASGLTGRLRGPHPLKKCGLPLLYHQPCQALAAAIIRVILSVDYRLAPDYPFSQPLEEIYQALCRVPEHAQQLNIGPERLAISGESRGNRSTVAGALNTVQQ